MLGKRGEGWVLLQAILMVGILLAPANQLSKSRLWLFIGAGLLIFGALIGLFAMRHLGRNLTPFPKPITQGQLVRTGLYSYVRHPIYLSVILSCTGWAFTRHSGIGLILSALLFLFFDAKSRQEERWLIEQYPDYLAYQQKAKRLIPWLY